MARRRGAGPRDLGYLLRLEPPDFLAEPPERVLRERLAARVPPERAVEREPPDRAVVFVERLVVLVGVTAERSLSKSLSRFLFVRVASRRSALMA